MQEKILGYSCSGWCWKRSYSPQRLIGEINSLKCLVWRRIESMIWMNVWENQKLAVARYQYAFTTSNTGFSSGKHNQGHQLPWIASWSMRMTTSERSFLCDASHRKDNLSTYFVTWLCIPGSHWRACVKTNSGASRSGGQSSTDLFAFLTGHLSLPPADAIYRHIATALLEV